MTEEEICLSLTKGSITEVESTLKNFDWNLDTGRKCGNTTRQVDLAIQILFNGKTCACFDHFQGGECATANIHLYNRIIQRLEFEYPEQKFKASRLKLIITLI